MPGAGATTAIQKTRAASVTKTASAATRAG